MSTDTTAPELKTLVIPVSVDLSKEVAGLTIAGTAIDDISGVKQLVVNFDKSINSSYSIQSDSFNKNNFIGNWGLTDSWLDGSSIQTFGIATTNANGIYNITSVDIDDIEGNRRSYSATKLKELGVNTSINFFGATPDIIAPELKTLVIPDSVDLSKGVAGLTIAGTAIDDISGVKQLVVNFDKPINSSYSIQSDSFNKNNFIGNWGLTDSWLDGSSIQTFGIATTNANGIYNITSVDIDDIEGNRRSYSANELKGLGVNTSLTITDGTFIKNNLIVSSSILDGNIVLSLTAAQWSSTTNIINFSLNYDSSIVHFESWHSGNSGSYAVNSTNSEINDKGTINIFATINNSGNNNFIQLIFSTYEQKGSFIYDLSSLSINSESIANIFGNYSFSDTLPHKNVAPLGAVKITGIAAQNEILAVSNDLNDANGLGKITYTWLRDGMAISDATQSTYILTQSDVGKKISVKASYTDGLGTAESVISSATSIVTNVNDAPTGSVNITGTAAKGQILTAANTLADPDGLGKISYTWLKNGAIIPNATQSTYKLMQADTEQNISVKASYLDSQDTPESVVSNSILVAPNSAPTGTATIKGLSTWGTTLSITSTIKDADGLGTLSYTWQNDSGELSKSSKYTLQQSDVGKQVWALVSYTDKKGNFETVKSNVIDVTVSTKPSAVNDRLTGTDAADKLSGLAGNDTLIGGLGKDTLIGGVGADVFKFASISDSSPLSKQADTITDFKHAQGDKIDLSAIDINPTLDGRQSFIPINAQTFSADATGQLRFDAKTSTLYGSINADVAPEFAIVLSGVKSLAIDDFIF